MRNIGNAVFAPTLIAAVMVAFLSATFAVAKALAHLSGDPRLGSRAMPAAHNRVDAGNRPLHLRR
jgi:hypothetical protein